MKISIVTVVKNGMPFLRDAIKSFELQKYINKELIIVYTKSNDGTKEFLDKISNNKKIIIEDKTNNRYNAINLGIKKSTGKIIGLLHADDIFFNNQILSNINKHIIKKNCDIVYGGILFSDRNNLKKIKRIWQPSKFNRNKIILGSVPPHVGMFMKKSVFNNIGYYSKKYTISSDYDFILRMVLSNKFKIESTNTFHNIMRIGGDSTSIKKIFLKLKEDYLIVRKHGLSIFTLLLKILSKTIQITKRKNINNNYINKFN
jgi:glycosyltransferase involved in cell wall biosynthesis